MFCDQIRQSAETAPRAALPAVAAALWKAFAEGHVTEAEAEALSALIEARQAGSLKLANQSTIGKSDTASNRLGSPRTGRTGSRPRTDASMERRRRWAASGRMPPAIAARFTLAEQSVLSLVAAETCRRKDCRLTVEHMAALAGVSRSTVKNAIREAAKLGLLTVEERPVTGWRNLSNVLRIVSPEWLSWLRLTRKRKLEGDAVMAPPSEGGGVKSPTCTLTDIQERGKLRPAEPSQGLPRGSGRPDRKRAERKRAAR
ncbi:helix-turn-helix domain-containing protein [Methylorubrum extorquens]